MRIPYWSQRTQVRVNGQSVSGVAAGSYLNLRRSWKKGDFIELRIDMRPHIWVGEKECRGRSSLYRGPILLTYDRRYNDMDPDQVPALMANKLGLRTVRSPAGTPEPMVMTKLKGAHGKTVYLCDFASAGEGGSPYLSWLHVKGMEKVRYSRANPLRSGRP
ncbi:uncharacterized protein METZ01_LOCUS509384 [marine metagenome]|uniref:Non-reducing end beta-L-arabinofuranosidase-like GH127 middle domain-containing protein n=1 Tax=marine metagenome TaxID=408172 RepID=A0A383EJM9_9ZZZZ